MTTFRALVPALALLLAAGPVAAQDVGVAAAVNQSAQSIRPNAVVRTIGLGDNVVYNERIDTNDVGLVQLLLADGTTFTVGPNSSLVIDSFVYDPEAGTAQVAATLTKGVLRFIGAATSKTPDGVSITTPIGVVGIRGGVTDINMNPPAGIPPHISMIFGNSVTLTSGGELLGRLFEAGYSLAATGGGIDTLRTPGEWSSQIQAALSSNPGQNGGAPKSPTSTTVAQSKVADLNSGQTPAVPPIPMPPLVRIEDFADDLVSDTDLPDVDDDHHNDDDVVVMTRKGISAALLGFTATGNGQTTDSGAIPVLTLPFGTNGALTEIGFNANGDPVAGVIKVNFADCAGCTITFNSENDTATLFGGPAGQTVLTLPVTSKIVSHEQANLPTNVQYCTCAFLDWGLWSAKGGTNQFGYGLDINLEGQWVVGDITTPAQLDQLAQLATTTATFAGTAIGTVTPDILATGNTYAAAGDLAMTWTFATRDGNLAVTGFDGRNFGGVINAPAGVYGFTGDITDDTATAFGIAQGVFVNDAGNLGRGIMGNFVIDDGTWGATGILIGERIR